jgi:hypothetical protein
MAQPAHHHGVPYTPAPLETAWMTRTEDISSCDLLKQQWHNADLHTWLHLSRNSLMFKANLLDAPPEQLSVLSQMPRSAKDGEKCPPDLIEPLNGALRHPLARSVCGGPAKWRATSETNFTYLILTDHCRAGCGRSAAQQRKREANGRPPPRRLFYDMGCAAYSDTSVGTRYKVAVRTAREKNTSVVDEMATLIARHERRIATTEALLPIGASLEVFRSLFRSKCIEFDHIFGWDAHPYKLANWMSRVPENDRAKISFFNERVNSTDRSALGVLKATARPEDFVVVKLDIDSPVIEQQILDRLLGGDEAIHLIDEFFFEYQGKDPHELDRGATAADNVAHGMEMMSALRRRGIRAHFWI